MNIGFKKTAVWLGAACLLGSAVHIRAFALLGPYESWMQESNGMRLPGYYADFGFTARPTDFGIIQAEDIGGPMDLGSGYRWNVPMITYGFDQSFLDYFGTNGVAAVKSAIQVLNDLPPASGIELTNYPVAVRQYNYAALALSSTNQLYDLKSQTLSVLLEELGLSQPARYTYVLKHWDPSLLPPDPGEYSTPLWWGGWAVPDFIVRRNFDPETPAASSDVNECLFSGFIDSFDGINHFMVTIAVNPEVEFYSVAEFHQNAGEFYTGLSRDDVGGLRYLLSTNTVNFETLLPGVRTIGLEPRLSTEGARRPGVDKITLVEQPRDLRTGRFLSCSYHYTDHFFKSEVVEVDSVRRTRAVLVKQPLQRVVTQPDILFSVSEIGSDASSPQVNCTDTTHWINNAALNGNPTGAGPGVIQPGITITFGKGAGPTFSGDPWLWASFDASTNVPIIYPTAP